MRYPRETPPPTGAGESRPFTVNVRVRVEVEVECYNGTTETLRTCDGTRKVVLDQLRLMKMPPETGARLLIGSLFEELRDDAARQIVKVLP
jgi:hypothetical protein